MGRSWRINIGKLKILHELWREESDGGESYAFFLAGPLGDENRLRLEQGAKLIWTVEADSDFEAMTKYHEYMGWGEYKIPSEWEDTKDPYPPEMIATQKGPNSAG